MSKVQTQIADKWIGSSQKIHGKKYFILLGNKERKQPKQSTPFPSVNLLKPDQVLLKNILDSIWVLYSHG